MASGWTGKETRGTTGASSSFREDTSRHVGGTAGGIRPKGGLGQVSTDRGRIIP